jgi:hypothetical protein
MNTETDDLKTLLNEEVRRQEEYRRSSLDWRMGIEQRLSLHAVTDQRVAALEKATERMAESIDELAKSMLVMARIEARQVEIQTHIDKSSAAVSRAFAEIKSTDTSIRELIKDHETRVRTIEAEMPTTRLVKSWVIGGVASAVAAIGTLLVSLVTR